MFLIISEIYLFLFRTHVNYKRKTMKENSFKRNRKAMMALLLCTGFIVTQPISVMAEEIMIFAQTAQQQKQSVSQELLKMLRGNL